MKRQLDLLLGAAVVTLIGACSTGEGSPAISAINGQAPMFEVDPFWPQPLPNHWLMGATIGVAVDQDDGIWLVHRNTPDQFAARTEIGLAR